MSDQNLIKARYGERLASLLGSCGIALGLGIFFSAYLGPFTIWLIILGAILHSWGMYKIHQRNK